VHLYVPGGCVFLFDSGSQVPVGTGSADVLNDDVGSLTQNSFDVSPIRQYISQISPVSVRARVRSGYIV
jgi:hypothetical protein